MQQIFNNYLEELWSLSVSKLLTNTLLIHANRFDFFHITINCLYSDTSEMINLGLFWTLKCA